MGTGIIRYGHRYVDTIVQHVGACIYIYICTYVCTGFHEYRLEDEQTR